MRFVWHEPGPIAADSGVLLVGATHTFDETPSPDILLVPGGVTTFEHARDEKLLDWVRRAHETATWTASVCSGSVILAAAGLLRGQAGHVALDGGADAQDVRRHAGQRRADRSRTKANDRDVRGRVGGHRPRRCGWPEQIVGEARAKAIQLAIEYDPQPPFDSGHISKASTATKATATAILSKDTSQGWPAGSVDAAAVERRDPAGAVEAARQPRRREASSARLPTLSLFATLVVSQFGPVWRRLGYVDQCGVHVEEIREFVLEYQLLPYGQKGSWLAAQGVSHRQLRRWQATVFDGDLDRGLIPREGSAMTVPPAKRTALAKAHAAKQDRDEDELARLQARVRELEETNEALGKAIGLLHAMSEEEPDAAPTTTDPDDSSNAENELVAELTAAIGSQRQALALIGLSRSTWHYRSSRVRGSPTRCRRRIGPTPRASARLTARRSRDRIIAGWQAALGGPLVRLRPGMRA